MWTTHSLLLTTKWQRRATFKPDEGEPGWKDRIDHVLNAKSLDDWATWRIRTRTTIRGFLRFHQQLRTPIEPNWMHDSEGRGTLVHILSSVTEYVHTSWWRYCDGGGWNRRWEHGIRMHRKPDDGGWGYYAISSVFPAAIQQQGSLPEMSIDPPTHPSPVSLCIRQHTITSPLFEFSFILFPFDVPFLRPVTAWPWLYMLRALNA